MEEWMRVQGYDMDQSLATKFQALLGATSRQQQPGPAGPPPAGHYAPSRIYTEDQLQSMSMVELRNVLRSLGLSSLGPLPKWKLIAHALEKQQQQPQQLLYTETELKSLPFFELEEIARNLNIQDTSLCLHSEIVELILATQISLRDSALLQQASTSTTTTPSKDDIALSSVPPPSSLPKSSQRSEGIKDCDLCYEPMGGNATKTMAVPSCGHLYCYDCWMKVIKNQGRCPQCARKVAAKDITKIYV
ncbi:hypothetical protein Ndes2526A_g01310 [Nannochloris sp. 'desiccata']|nr:hypothetical protein KSW81_004337 [Chlorella desiccata (nom. nud.)]